MVRVGSLRVPEEVRVREVEGVVGVVAAGVEVDVHRRAAPARDGADVAVLADDGGVAPLVLLVCGVVDLEFRGGSVLYLFCYLIHTHPHTSNEL